MKSLQVFKIARGFIPSLAAVLVSLIFFPGGARAGFEDSNSHVLKVKDKQVLISTDTPATIGDVYIAYDANGKRKGILKITKAGKAKALAKLLKGRAEVDWIVAKYEKSAPKPAAPPAGEGLESEVAEESESPAEEPSESTESAPASLGKQYKVGLLLDYSLNSSEVLIDGTAVSMSGSTFNYHVFGVYKLSPDFDVFGTFGFFHFDTEGTTTGDTCNGSNDCVTTIPYTGLSAMLRYHLPFAKKFDPWIGASAGLLKPGTADSNAIDTNSISTTFIYGLGGGLDYRLNSDFTIPVGLRYMFFPNADNVKAHFISIQFGLGYNF